MHKKLTKLLTVCLILMAAVLFFPSAAKADTGWVREANGKTYHYDEEGSKTPAGWYLENSTWYYLEEDGARVENEWVLYNGAWYYLKEEGVMAASEWLEYNGALYYFKAWGAMYANTWATVNGKDYYFRAWGATYRDSFATVNGKLNYFMHDGSRLKNDWILLNGSWYYAKADGTIAQNEWLLYNNAWYWLKDKGVMAASEWIYEGEQWYYFKAWGAMYANEWVTYNNARYYLRSWGGMAVGWTTIGSNTYYFRPWGALATNTTIDGYPVDANGVRGQRTGKLIALDPGHQARGNSEKEPNGPGSTVMKAKCTSGTQGVVTGLEESVLNLTVAKKVKAILESRGYSVYMIRETQDVNISNKERAQAAANAGADILVRIHGNSVDNSSVTGALTYSPTSSNPYLTKACIRDSQPLSQKMVNAFCAATGARNRDVLYADDMSGINWSTIPVTIIEMGFMSNPDEDRLMATDAYQNKMAKGIADGIDAYYAAK